MSLLKVLRSTPFRYENVEIRTIYSMQGYKFVKKHHYVFTTNNYHEADIDKLFAIKVRPNLTHFYKFNLPGLTIVGYSPTYMKFMFVMYKLISNLPKILLAAYVGFIIFFINKANKIIDEVKKELQEEEDERNNGKK